jgi:hypothetical protein
MTGLFVSIHIAGEAEGPMGAVESVRALPGKGLDGDRYSRGADTFSNEPELDQKVTVIEEDTLEAVARRDYGVTINPGATRRNMVTGTERSIIWWDAISPRARFDSAGCCSANPATISPS